MLNLILNQKKQGKLQQWLSGVTSWIGLTFSKVQTLAMSGAEGVKAFAEPHTTHLSNNLKASYEQLQKAANSPRAIGYCKKADMIFSNIYYQLNPIARKQIAEIKYVLANEARILMKNNSPAMQKLFEQLSEMQTFAYGPQQYEKYESILDSISCNIISNVIDKNGLSSESLDLRHCYLTRITGPLLTAPEYQSYWASLKKLNLEWNNLDSLPKEISQLAALEELWMSDNNFQTIPPAIGMLSELKILAIANNPVESIPPEIESLKKLTTFDIDKSSLSLPANLEEANWRNPRNKGVSPFFPFL